MLAKTDHQRLSHETIRTGFLVSEMTQWIPINKAETVHIGKQGQNTPTKA